VHKIDLLSIESSMPGSLQSKTPETYPPKIHYSFDYSNIKSVCYVFGFFSITDWTKSINIQIWNYTGTPLLYFDVVRSRWRLFSAKNVFCVFMLIEDFISSKCLHISYCQSSLRFVSIEWFNKQLQNDRISLMKTNNGSAYEQ